MYKQRPKVHVGPRKANISGNANNVTNILLPVSLLSQRTNRPTTDWSAIWTRTCENDSLTEVGHLPDKKSEWVPLSLHMVGRNNKMEIFGMFFFSRVLTEKNFDENINPFDGFLLNSKRRCVWVDVFTCGYEPSGFHDYFHQAHTSHFRND